MGNDDLRGSLDRDGYAIRENVLSAGDIAALLEALDGGKGGSERRRGGAVYARRNLLDVEAVRAVARSAAVRALVEPVLGPGCFAVRGLLFDKTPEANWKVVWHQDLSIAVTDKREVAGFGPWSLKAGVMHVQPPMQVLERMLAVRLHLDPCDESNGPLRVLAGTQLSGRLDAEHIMAWREKTRETVCVVPRGGALVMRPLLLHASSPAVVAGHRRVLHLEWAAEGLAGGLQWRDVVGQ